MAKTLTCLLSSFGSDLEFSDFMGLSGAATVNLFIFKTSLLFVFSLVVNAMPNEASLYVLAQR